MTAKEFNTKYAQYLKEGHYGLSFTISSIVDYLDKLFEENMIKLPNFKYSQIKLKFNMARFYFTTDLPNKIEMIIEMYIEEEINKLVAIEDKENTPIFQ